MTLIGIVAADVDGIIGVGNDLPWKLPSDLRRFKNLTLGHPVIMGRRTVESLPGPLRDRTVIVLTRNPEYEVPPGAVRATTVKMALDLASRQPGADQVFVAGGAEVYDRLLPSCELVYLTSVHVSLTLEKQHLFESDEARLSTKFLPYNWILQDRKNPAWREIARLEHVRTSGDEYDTTFRVLEYKGTLMEPVT